MTTEKNTSPVREPYDAMGPVDAPNPPAARAPLADVQPGGRVRLGDQALRVFSAGRWTYDGTGQSFSHEEMDAAAFVVYRDAALSAQPSPGGQGGLNYERMFVDACAALAEVSRELGCDPEQGGAEPILAAIAELREALAARQPVGEVSVKKEDANNYCLILRALGMEEEGDPVAEVRALIDARDRQPVGELVAWVHEEDPSRVISASQKATALRDQGASGSSVRPYSVPAYLHVPPAQAVDLGRWSQRHADDLHVALHTALSVHAGSLSQKKRAFISAHVKRLLIDSQAVGNG